MKANVSSVLLALLLGACGAPPQSAAAPGVKTPTATTVASAAPPAAPLSATLDARALLEQLVSVDTSHGNETAALAPVRDRFRATGIPVEIVESAPGRGNLIARIKGNGTKKPLLLLAHIDVVPAFGQPWTTAPFTPIEKDGFLYGRGVNDDKSMATAIIVVALELARDKTPLSRDIIVALTAGEETGGFAGVQWLVKNRRDLIDAEIALNEGAGLQLTQDMSKMQAVGIGVAEKTYQSYRLVVRGNGGHSSVPPTDADPVTTLSRGLLRLADVKFVPHVVPEVKESLALQARWEKAPLADALRHAAASAPKLLPADDKLISKDRIYNALTRTTCVTTMLQGSTQDNVLPTSAEATVNCRILPDETREQTLAALRKAVSDPAIAIEPISDFGMGPPSPLEGEVPAAIRKVSASMWPGVEVAPSMSTGATDSRHLRGIGILAYGIGTAPSSLDENRTGHSAHGPDERRPIKWLDEGVRYMRELTLMLAK